MPMDVILKGLVNKVVTLTAYSPFKSYFKKMSTLVRFDSYSKKFTWVIIPAIPLNEFMPQSQI